VQNDSQIIKSSNTRKVAAAKTAGILSIIAGAIFIVSAVFGFFFLKVLIDAFTLPSSRTDGIPWSVVAVFTIPMAVIGVIAILGGREAVSLHKWSLALAGSICAIICFWILGIPALVLLLSSRREFARKADG
jgi:hypothetical protein